MNCLQRLINLFKKCCIVDDDLNEVLINDTFNEVVNNENKELDICTEILYENI